MKILQNVVHILNLFFVCRIAYSDYSSGEPSISRARRRQSMYEHFCRYERLRICLFHVLFLMSFILLSCNHTGNKEMFLEKGFQSPPPQARPYAWWHWISGHISREGITRDLEAMAEQGIGGATIFNVGLNDDLFSGRMPVYDFMTPEWRELVTHAMSEASRLGLDVLIHNCDGWGHSGGPWIQPHEAMKTVTYSRMAVQGPASFHDTLPLPPSKLNFYRDIAALAFPSPASDRKSMHDHRFEVFSDTPVEDLWRIVDMNQNSSATFTPEDHGKPVSVTIAFTNPFSAACLIIADDEENQAERMKRYHLEYSDDGITFHTIKRFSLEGTTTRINFAEKAANYFRVSVYDFGWLRSGYLNVPELELIGKDGVPYMPKINDFELKAGYWIRRRDQHAALPVPENWIIDAGQQVYISSHMADDGVLQWDVPEGNWEIFRIGYTLTGKMNGPATDAGRGLECDKLDARFTEAFFNGMPRQLINDNEAFAGPTFTHYLTDSWEAYCQNWSDHLPEEFLIRRGYSIIPYLPVLCGEVVGSVDISERFLFDFRQTIADLIKENFYGRFNALCNENGLQYQAEASGAQQYFFDPITYPSVVDQPMTEFWITPDRDFPPLLLNGDVMGAVAAAQLYDKGIVSAEAFTCSKGNWRQTPFNLKPAGDMAFSLGINKLVFHTFAHQPDETYPGWQMVPHGIAMNRKQTWWDNSHVWLSYLARCQFMLQQGHFVGDVLAFHGEGTPVSMYYAYQPDSVRLTAQSNTPDFLGKQEMMDAIRGITPRGYAWTGCNAETIIERLRVKGNRLYLPNGMSYRMLLLPDRAEMTPALLMAIERLVKAGAVVVGPRPLRSPSLEHYPECDHEVASLAGRIWGNIDGKDIVENRLGKGRVYCGIGVEGVMERLGIAPAFTYESGSQDSDVVFIHRRLGDTDFYFLSNQTMRSEHLDCWFRVKGKQPELWNPDRGTIEPLMRYELSDKGVRMPLSLDPYGSAFVVFRNQAGRRITGVTLDGDNADHLIELKQEAGGKVLFMVNKPGRYLMQDSRGKGITVDLDQIPNPMEVTGTWKVHFPSGWGAPGQAAFNDLTSWHLHEDEGIRYFSGSATYEKEFKVPSAMLTGDYHMSLDLGEVREVASVLVNDVSMGVLWKLPYSMDITHALKPGVNTLTIRVSNGWSNRLIGDEKLPDQERFTRPITRMHYDEPHEQVLRPSGLLGPVKITFFSKHYVSLNGKS